MAGKPKSAEVDAEIARLYGLPLEEFTPARNALAAQRKKSGDREAADEIRSLAKPSVSAWAVNQLFLRERGRMDDLLGAGASARTAQGETIAGAGASTLRKALQTARDLAEDLRRRALEILSENGRPVNAAVAERIGANLQALAFSPDAAEAAKRGWLDADLNPPGFEVLAGLQIAAGGDRPARSQPAAVKKPAAPEPRGRKKAASDKEADRARERKEKEEARRREQRERDEARLRERLARAEAEATRTASEADFLRRKAEQAEKALAEATRHAEEARQAAEAASQRSERSAEALSKVREEVKALRAK